ncbi:nitrate- and nitrite sensing domain-containing protein [Actinomadura sp. NAK00032]|uniref:sensor histidine kinase n=1 Tax=Actinomadura sp. NAK00032 TaxID=2742128 RepID=UPI0015996D56|nr:nitrate- and nitrite sensing domain-containing protein [Actinomadura sp. NAK00032]QKW39414.1 nitrate- and nitrite sensing domain-containing protein [Actinomadura sp. NAK00032]
MRFRNSRLRTKIAALLLSLTALWAFAAWVTLREGVNLLWVSTYDSKLATPSDPLLVELQRERRLTAVWIASPSQRRHEELTTQRTRTDRAAAELEKGARSGTLRRAADDDLERRVDEMLDRLHKLDAQRKTVDARTIARSTALQGYTTTIDSVFRMYDAMGTLDDKGIAKNTGILIELNRSWELLSQEDALVAGVLAVGRVKQDEMTQIVQISGIRRYALSKALTQLEHEDEDAYRSFTSSARLRQLEAVENRLTAPRAGRAARIPAVTAAEWESTTTPALAEMRDTVQDAGARLVDRSTPVAAGVITRLALAGGLGLLAVIASIVVSITTARALVRQLERLRGAAWELAEQRLPSVVERLGHGEKVDVAVEAPPLQFGGDEIGQVGRAFNAVQETAIRTAVEQAELRRGIRDVLLSLARRTQALVHRQLSMLDTMERKRDIDPKDLEELFRLDHLATRMRRNAENLIVLSGSIPARGWRQPVPMVDVIRAAVGEVEDYTRVTVLPFGPVELAGRAVGDVTHLLAELIENAVSFSPPDTAVHVGGHLVANGFAIDIEDRGLGMTEDKLAEINERIVDPPEFNLRSSVQLGLFVVAKLAERYGVRVSLKRSAYGGTTAVVVIPQDLVVEAGTAKAPAATTENGLAVRQPAAVPAGASEQAGQGSVVTLTRQPAGSPPALVAVPPPASEPDDASAPQGDPRTTGPQATGPQTTGPQTTGPQGGDPNVTGPQAAEPRTTGPQTVTTATGPQATGPQTAPAGAPAPTRSPGEPAPPGGPAAAGGGDSATSPPEDQPPVTESTTPSGLPVRVPQANLAAPLRTDEPVVAQEPDEPDVPGRSPEEIQRIMGSYQRGTRLARTAVETRGNEAVEGEDEQ